jgi:hypothetical protein
VPSTPTVPKAAGRSPVVQCHEVWPGAADTGTSGRYYLDKLTRKHAVALHRTDGSAFMLPTWEPFEYTREDEIWDTPLWAEWLEKLKTCGLVPPTEPSSEGSERDFPMGKLQP